MQASELRQRRRRRAAQRRALNWPDSDRFLHRQLREQLLERLDWTRLEARQVLDLGCGNGAALAELQRRYPEAQVFGLDHSHSTLQRCPAGANRLCAAAECLPLNEDSLDLIFANLTLAYCPDLPACLSEARRVLRTPGLLNFVTLGRESMAELGRAWATADSFHHLPPQPDMHNLGDLLVQAGFSEPVLDTDVITVTYANADQLIGDLRAAGAVNAMPGCNPGLTSRAASQRLRQALAAQAGKDGRFPITLEVVFGQAWTALPAQRSRAGFQEVPLDQISLPGQSRP